MISELQKWKEEFKKSNVKPWDVLSPELRADPKVGAARMTICEQCPQLIKGIKQCKECGCFMKVKVYLKDATCPLGKWDRTVITPGQADFSPVFPPSTTPTIPTLG